MDMLLGSLTEVIELKNKEPLIEYGKFDNNVYILKEGIIRHTYFDGLKEMTSGFSNPGTPMVSYHSFYQGIPAFFQLESCGRSVVIKISKAEFDDLLRRSSDLTNWFLHVSLRQLYSWEMKAAVVNGSARERFESLIKNRPEILKRVSNKVIASYVGISQPYLNVLKKEILQNPKK